MGPAFHPGKHERLLCAQVYRGNHKREKVKTTNINSVYLTIVAGSEVPHSFKKIAYPFND